MNTACNSFHDHDDGCNPILKLYMFNVTCLNSVIYQYTVFNYYRYMKANTVRLVCQNSNFALFVLYICKTNKSYANTPIVRVNSLNI